jgi:hypothetical protein
VSEALATFAAIGGAPPGSYEAIEVHHDGTVVARLGTAWPDGLAADQAGRFEWTLASGALDELRALLDAVGPAPKAATGPDAGGFSLELAGRTLQWGLHDEAPEALTRVERRFARLRAEAREHPAAAVRLSLSADAGELGFRFEARGGEPVTISVRERGLSVLLLPPDSGADPPSPLWSRRAVPVGAPGAGPTTLAPGESLLLTGTTEPVGERQRVDGFAWVELGDLSALLAASAA